MRFTAGGDVPASPPGFGSPILNLLPSSSLRVLRGGNPKVNAVCSEACRIELRLTRRRRTIAHGGTRARAGELVAIRLRLTHTGKRYLKRADSAKLVLRGTVTDTAGNRRSLRSTRGRFR